MGVQHSVAKLSEEEQRAVLDFNVSVKSIADKIKDLELKGECGVVVMAGAGISVSAGIPDFRSPDTGLYANLQKYNLPSPQSMFEIEYFKESPQAFNTLAKEMWPGNFSPTPTHFFIKLLQQKGVLRRCFTQNIDTLEREAGIDVDCLVEAHGSFGEAHCIGCNEPYSQEWIRQEIFQDKIPRCPKCQALVKPDIVFFGENLPRRFADCRKNDLPSAKVLLVMGTSLSVSPFCELIHEVPADSPRLLINLDMVGSRRQRNADEGFRFDEVENYRDAALLQDCDSGVRLLCRYLDWEQDLDQLIIEFHASKSTSPTTAAAPAAAATATTTASSGVLDTDDKKLNYNWKKPPPVLPPLQPIGLVSSTSPNEAPAIAVKEEVEVNTGEGESPAVLPNHGMTLSLVEPASLAEVQGGKHAWFKLSFADDAKLQERLTCDYDFLGLYQGGAKLCEEKTDRDWPFSEKAPAYQLLQEEKDAASPSSASSIQIQELEISPATLMAEEHEKQPQEPEPLSARHAFFESPNINRALRLRIPWIHYQLPYDLEIWYVDGITNDVLARWGPLTIHENAPNDPKEEEQEAGPGKGMPKLSASEQQELIAKLAAEFGLPPEMIGGMIKNQMGGQADEGEEDDDGSNCEEESNQVDGKSELRAGFSAFKEATLGDTNTSDTAITTDSGGGTAEVMIAAVEVKEEVPPANLECD